MTVCSGLFLSWLHILLEHARCPRVQGVVKALFECGMLPTVLSGSSVGSISAPLSPSALPPHFASCPILTLLQIIQLRTCFRILPSILDPAAHICAVCAIIATRDDNELKEIFRDMLSVDLSFFSNSSIAQVRAMLMLEHTVVQSTRCDRTCGSVRCRRVLWAYASSQVWRRLRSAQCAIAAILC